MFWGLHDMWQLGRCFYFIYIFWVLKNVSFPKGVKFPPSLECLCPFLLNVRLKAVNLTKLDACSREEGYLYFISYIWFLVNKFRGFFSSPLPPFLIGLRLIQIDFTKKFFDIFFLFLFIFF